jgi:hypothetical protein
MPRSRGLGGLVMWRMSRGWEVLTVKVCHLLGLPVSIIALLNLIHALTSHFDGEEEVCMRIVGVDELGDGLGMEGKILWFWDRCDHWCNQ